MLLDYPWPGNVRQLRSTIRRATLLADQEIANKHLDLKKVLIPGLAPIPKGQSTPWQGSSLQKIVQASVDQVEREVLTQVLNHTGGNKSRAARLLQIDYKTIHMKLKKLGIWKAQAADGDQEVDPEPESSESEPSVLGVDELRTRRQRRATLAA
jgi:two-component system nitrogen regulation response regulator GlnG